MLTGINPVCLCLRWFIMTLLADSESLNAQFIQTKRFQYLFVGNTCWHLRSLQSRQLVLHLHLDHGTWETNGNGMCVCHCIFWQFGSLIDWISNESSEPNQNKSMIEWMELVELSIYLCIWNQSSNIKAQFVFNQSKTTATNNNVWPRQRRKRIRKRWSKETPKELKELDSRRNQASNPTIGSPRWSQESLWINLWRITRSFEELLGECGARCSHLLRSRKT